MKIFKKTLKILLYFLLVLTIFISVGSSYIYYRLVFQNIPITLNSIHLKHRISDNVIDIGLDDLLISVDKTQKSVIISGVGSLDTYDNKLPIYKTGFFEMNADFSNFFSSFHIPLNITIKAPKLFPNNILALNKKSRKYSGTSDLFNQIYSSLDDFSKQKFIFIQNLNISEAQIIYKDCNYKLALDSTLTAENKLNGILTLDDSITVSKMQLSIDNTKQQIATELQFKQFPIKMFTDFIPEEYSTSGLINVDRNLVSTGTIQYLINKNNNQNDLVIRIEDQSSKEIKNLNPNSLNLLSFNISADNNLNNVSINKFIVKLNNNAQLDIQAQLTKLSKIFSDAFKIKGNITAQNIPINSVESLWPLDTLPPAREWLIESMKNGVINSASCELNIKDTNHIDSQDIIANLQFSGIDLKYDEEYDELTNLNGTASFNANNAKIIIQSGTLLSSKITEATVEIIYDDPMLPLIISATTKGIGKDYLNFIGKENLQNIQDQGLDLTNISSTLEGKVFIKIPLEKEISLENTTLDINATLKDTKVNFRNIKITEGNLLLLIDNKTVKLSGPANINNQPGTINWVSNFDNEDDAVFDHKLNLSIAISPQSDFENMTNKNFQIIKGVAKAKIEYMSYPKYELANAVVDLSNASFTIPIINLVKDESANCSFNLAMKNEENKIWQTTQLELISNNGIDIKGYAEFNNDLSNILVLNSDLKFKENNISIQYKNSDNQIILILNGEKIDLSKSSPLDLLKQGANPNYDKLMLDMKIRTLVMANDIIFQNVIGNFNCIKDNCTKGSLTLGMNTGGQASMKLTKNNDRSQWVLKSDDASSLFKALSIYKNIKGGELTLTLTSVDKNKTNIQSVYEGEVNLTNFTATKTPILAKLISFSSFRGILSILQNYHSIPFQKMYGKFIFSNSIIRINQTYFTGNFLTLSLNGTIDLNKEYINFYGKVIPPVYGFNHILALIPFIGHPLAGSPNEKGLISANYTIKGKFDNTTVYVNPMGLFLPEGLVNMFAP